MKIEADSFAGKLWLLIIDKIIIGAIIAVGFVAYDSYRTTDTRHYEERQAKLQLEFERARLAREFLPLIRDPKADVVARGYALRAAVITESLDAEAAVELGRELLAEGIPEEHFRRVMAATLPEGVRAIAAHGAAMERRWRDEHPSPFRPTGTYNPVSGIEHIPEAIVGQITEARLWRAILIDALPSIEASRSLDETEEIVHSLYGLFVLLQSGDSFGAERLSRSSSRAIALIGHLERLQFREQDGDAVEYVAEELLRDHSSLENIRLANLVLDILLEYGPPSGTIALPISRLLTEPRPRLEDGESGEVHTAHYWLQWRSANVLLAMAEESERGQGGRADPAERVLVNYLLTFAGKLRQAEDAASLDMIARGYESGKLVRRIVEIVGTYGSDEARLALESLLSQGDDKLRYFPFLEADLARALRSRKEDSA